MIKQTLMNAGFIVRDVLRDVNDDHLQRYHRQLVIYPVLALIGVLALMFAANYFGFNWFNWVLTFVGILWLTFALTNPSTIITFLAGGAATSIGSSTTLREGAATGGKVLYKAYFWIGYVWTFAGLALATLPLASYPQILPVGMIVLIFVGYTNVAFEVKSTGLLRNISWLYALVILGITVIYPITADTIEGRTGFDLRAPTANNTATGEFWLDAGTYKEFELGAKKGLCTRFYEWTAGNAPVYTNMVDLRGGEYADSNAWRLSGKPESNLVTADIQIIVKTKAERGKC